MGEELDGITVVLQEGGCGRVTGQSLDGKSPGLCKASLDRGPIFRLTDGHRAGLQLGLVPWGFISFV